MRWLALLLALVACAEQREAAEGAAESVFPHPEDYVAAHGADAVADGATCSSCHPATRGTPATGPACTSCHAAYPHADGIEQGSVHGPLWAGGGCTACHGDAGDRDPAGQVPGACTGCHTTYPHPESWTSPAMHGASVLAHGGTDGCTSCHGATFDATGTACHTCHAAYPHPDGWVAPSAHGASDDSCGSCHDSTDPLDTPSCATCHDVYPHADGWTTGHLPVVQRRGDAACLGCHPAGSLAGPAIEPSCTDACHGASP